MQIFSLLTHTKQILLEMFCDPTTGLKSGSERDSRGGGSPKKLVGQNQSTVCQLSKTGRAAYSNFA